MFLCVQVEYFNNYLKDPKRPQLPEHPGSRAQKREHPGDREGFSGGSGGFAPQWVHFNQVHLLSELI